MLLGYFPTPPPIDYDVWACILMFTSKITNYCMNGVILVGDLFYYYVFHPHPVLEESSVSPPPSPPPSCIVWKKSLHQIWTSFLVINMNFNFCGSWSLKTSWKGYVALACCFVASLWKLIYNITFQNQIIVCSWVLAIWFTVDIGQIYCPYLVFLAHGHFNF